MTQVCAAKRRHRLWTWSAAFVVAGPWLAQLAQLDIARDVGNWRWLVFSPCATLAGWLILDRMRKAGATADDLSNASVLQRTLVPGTFGMLAGLLWDARGAGLSLAAALCGAGAARGIGSALWLHWSSLPAMHTGMLAGCCALPVIRSARGAAARMRRTARTTRTTRPCAADRGTSMLTALVCCAGYSVSMLAGMTVGAFAMQRVAATFAAHSNDLAAQAAAMSGGMFAGMVWGIAAYALCSRAVAHVLRAAAPSMESEHGQHRPVRP